jgi:hypothetical protein
MERYTVKLSSTKEWTFPEPCWLRGADSEPCRSGFRGHADQENDRVGDDVGTKLGTTE